MGGKTKTQFKGVIMLMLTAAIWGSAFVAQNAASDKIQAFTFIGIRNMVAALALFVFLLIKHIITSKKLDIIQRSERNLKRKKALKYGIPLGVVFCIASNLQQEAFSTTDTDTIAFITALYMFFVPIIGLFFRKKVGIPTWICICIGIVGMYFLCIDPKAPFDINIGNLLALGCAFFFAVQILMIEKFSPEVDGIELSFVQFAVCGILSVALMFIFETPSVSNIRASWFPIAYAALMSSCIAYTLQIFGQKYTEATIASLIMCLESVFAVLTTALIDSTWPPPRKAVGCGIMFAAIILSQTVVPLIEKRKAAKSS